MIIPNPKYAFDDLTILPCPQSTIDSRDECNPFDENGMLPLITSPMYSVVDERNVEIFIKNSIYGIYPRGCKGNNVPNSFQAYGLDEFINKYLKHDEVIADKHYVLIDIANGHMIKLTETVEKAKAKYGQNLVLMVGNIANPDTYRYLSDAGTDYVRLGAGVGSVCVTSCNSSVHAPLASLIDECYDRKDDDSAKIIADGGMRNFDDIIKALGLGADYVMCGSIFNKALESAGKTFLKHEHGVHQHVVDQFSEETKKEYKNGLELMKEHYGMSTKRAQREMGHENLKTSEGIAKINRVEYTLGQWRENFIHYLKTAMSYTGKRRLSGFKGKVDFAVITSAAHQAYRK